MESVPRLYSDLAEWWALLSAPEDYAEEAAFYARTLSNASAEPPREVLELGSGGGNNASHMKRQFVMTLVDLSPGMLKQSRQLNPECEHIEGDMRSVRLDREFDAVFVHDAIEYMTSIEDLTAAVRTAFVHTKPGGIALFCPDNLRESFVSSTEHGGHDGDGRALRYLQWSWDPDPNDCTYIGDYVYMLRNSDGAIEVVSDRHLCGLYSSDEWIATLSTVGYSPSILPFVHSEVEQPLAVVLGKKPLR